MTKKYTSLRQLPFRARLSLGLLYLAALGLVNAAAFITSSIWVMLACLLIEVWMIAYLMKRTV